MPLFGCDTDGDASCEYNKGAQHCVMSVAATLVYTSLNIQIIICLTWQWKPDSGGPEPDKSAVMIMRAGWCTRTTMKTRLTWGSSVLELLRGTFLQPSFLIPQNLTTVPELIQWDRTRSSVHHTCLQCRTSTRIPWPMRSAANGLAPASSTSGGDKLAAVRSTYHLSQVSFTVLM